MIQNVMALCDKSGQFLFQVMPDRFPYGRISDVEMALWSKYFDAKNARAKAKRQKR